MKTRYDAAVMHDFFVDRLVHVTSIERLMKMVHDKASAGGGGLHGIEQAEIRGGNAVNLAHALAKLGLRTLLVTHADAASEHLLRDTFEGLPAELVVKPIRAGLTVAFEGRVNVMLGDKGGASDFGPERLEEEDWDALRRSKVVCCVNWAENEKGTALLESLRERLGPRKKIFMDPADFRDRIPEFRTLLHLIRRKHIVDWISMNEEEGIAAAKALGLKSRGLADTCRELANELRVDFDLHARKRAYRSGGEDVVAASVRKPRARRLTGAGDVWDAGSIFGWLKRWDDRRTLEFANAAARLYLESPTPVPPTTTEVKEALGRTTSRAFWRRSK